MGNEVNALSIIDTVDIDNISTTMNKIAQMQIIVQKTLRKVMILEKCQEQVNQHY